MYIILLPYIRNVEILDFFFCILHSAKSDGGGLKLNTHAPGVDVFDWSATVNWCMVVWCTQNVCRDGSSFTWHQPCNNQIALSAHHLSGYSKCPMKGYSHSFRSICDKKQTNKLEFPFRSIVSICMLTFFLLSSAHRLPALSRLVPTALGALQASLSSLLLTQFVSFDWSGHLSSSVDAQLARFVFAAFDGRVTKNLKQERL